MAFTPTRLPGRPIGSAFRGIAQERGASAGPVDARCGRGRSTRRAGARPTGRHCRRRREAGQRERDLIGGGDAAFSQLPRRRGAPRELRRRMESGVRVRRRQAGGTDRWPIVVGLALAIATAMPSWVVNRTVIAAGLQAPVSTLPELTQPVNDFARVIDDSSSAVLDQMVRSLKDASGDVVVIATVPTIAPYGDIREYANKLFENHGRGIGDKGKDNGLLILLAVNERKVWIEVGYA